MPKSEPEPLAALTEAILGLTKQLEIYNRRNEPQRITGRGDAEIFRADYREASQEQREVHDFLKNLEAEDSERRSLSRPKRRSA
jgi:hypothetical protein